MRRSLRITGAVTVLGAAALATAALAAAGLGKAGLWEVTTHADMSGMMASLTPEQRARMKAAGIQMPENNTFTMTHCVTAAEVGQFKPPTMGRAGHEKDCNVANLKTTSNSASADLVCTGEHMKGGHFSLVYDTPEHYAGKVTMNTVVQGHPSVSNISFEAKWLSADCKAK
jgi:Protein of unknown function (DUF3617)